MKNFAPIALGLLFLFVQFSCKEEVMPPEECSVSQETYIDLSGEWTMLQIQCPAGVYQDEIISISHNLETGEIVATKITGDDCVTAGHVTFTGNLPKTSVTLLPEVFFDATFVIGLPSNPNSGTTMTRLQVLDINSMINFENLDASPIERN